MASTLGSIWERHRWLILVAAAALAVRLGYLYYYSTLPEWTQLTVDNYYHLHWAQRIADGDLLGATTYFRAPFYVYTLSLVIAFFGDSLWTLRLFGTLIGLLSVILTYLIARRVLNERSALLAAVIHALYPTAVYFDGELLLDPLFTLLTQLALWRVLIWWEQKTVRSAFLCGLFFGLAAITRPTALVLLIALIAFVLVWKQMGRIRYRFAVVIAAGALLCILPITLRNLIIAGDPVLIASQAGINLYIGNNAHADGISAVMPQPFGHNWQISDISYVAEIKEGKPLSSGEISDYWSRQAYNWILHHSLDWASLYLKKLYYSISDREISNNRDMDDFFARVPFLRYHPFSFALIFALGVVGACVAWKARPATRLLTSTTLLFIAANALFFVNSRFRLPEIPLLIILSVGALAWMFESSRIRRRTGQYALAAAVLLYLLSSLPIVGFPKGEDLTGLASKAIFHYRQAHYQQAIEIGQKIIERDPKFPEANLNIGAAWFRLGVGDSALYYFERERGNYPGRAKAYNNLASYYLVNRDLDSAYNKLNRALLLRPYDLTANTLLIRIASADDNVPDQELTEYISSALLQTDSNLTVMLEAATIASARKLYPLAEQLLRRSLELPPPPVETDDLAFDEAYPYRPDRLRRLRAQASYQWGFVLGQTGRFEESIAASRTAIELDSTFAEAYINLFSGYLSTNQMHAADSVLSQAARLFPNDSRVRQLIDRLKR
ncbi:MAG: glycosyltransferase family 39 protein [bacterium]|nr:glycosyltransferase family 39 protein [bacterium]